MCIFMHSHLATIFNLPTIFNFLQGADMQCLYIKRYNSDRNLHFGQFFTTKSEQWRTIVAVKPVYLLTEITRTISLIYAGGQWWVETVW